MVLFLLILDISTYKICKDSMLINTVIIIYLVATLVVCSPIFILFLDHRGKPNGSHSNKIKPTSRKRS